MTKFVVLHTDEGCIICQNVVETDTAITVKVADVIIEDVPKNIVTNYV